MQRLEMWEKIFKMYEKAKLEGCKSKMYGISDWLREINEYEWIGIRMWDCIWLGVWERKDMDGR